VKRKAHLRQVSRMDADLGFFSVTFQNYEIEPRFHALSDEKS